MSQGPISDFIDHHYRHFNAAALVSAAKGYREHLDSGQKNDDHLGGSHEHGRVGPVFG